MFSIDAKKRAMSFLWSNLVGKGVATYGNGNGIGEFISVPSLDMMSGWTSPHPDVSLAALLANKEAEEASEIVNWLNSLITKEGFVKSYWWRSPFYATALFLRYHNESNIPIDEEWALKMLTSMNAMQLSNGGFGLNEDSEMDTFVTAISLEMLTFLSSHTDFSYIEKCAVALLRSQKEDGSWAGGYNMRIPAPFVLDPEDVISYNNPDIGGNSLVMDKGGLFATAMACHALHCWRNLNN